MKTPIKKWTSMMLLMAMVMLLPFNALAVATTNGTATENNGVITISGTVTGAVAGQKVTVLVVNDNADINNLAASDIAYVNQVVPSNGNYNLTFTMPVSKRTGTYDVYVGGTNVSTPDDDSFTFATEAPTEAPTAAPVAPTVEMTAKPAVNGANAFYYVMTITLNDGVASDFVVKHYPTTGAGSGEENAKVQEFGTSNISGVTVKLISVLKGIPDGEVNREIATKATLSFTLSGNAGSVTETGTTSLNDLSN